MKSGRPKQASTETQPTQPMSKNPNRANGNTGWNWVSAEKPDSVNRVKIPPALIDEGIFETTDMAYWGFNSDTGTRFVSPDELEVPEYEPVASRSIGGPGDGHRSTIPHQFYSDSSGKTHLEAQKVDPTFDDEETLHFLYHDEVKDRDRPWCYVLTTSELEQRLLPHSDWPETVFPEPVILY